VSGADSSYGLAIVHRVLPLLLAVTLLASAQAAAATTTSTDGASPVNDQGSNANYRSQITTLTPTARGLSVQVLEFADRLLLVNHTGETVTVYGYQGEPYARVLPDGTAEQNERSPATYLNASFYGNTAVPAVADPSAPPRWKLVDRTGAFEWHDHRIHWASPTLPPQVTDRAKRTLVFDWQVPIAVGARRGAIGGQLFWVPNSSSAPLAAIVLGAVIVLGGLGFVLYVRARRSRMPAGGGQTDGAGVSDDEAW
jgi:hypothetical protein